MASINVDVVRALSAAPELRKADKTDESLGLLSGHFSAFNNWYRVSSLWEGDFLERTAPGFTAQTIAEDRSDMRVLFNHGFDGAAGDKVLGPIQDLREDETGPYYEVPLFDTSYNRDLVPGLKAGVYGASFRMRVQEDSWNDEPEPSDDNPKGLPERTITRAKVMEFGPVTFPANPEASASVRSTTDEFYERLRQRDRSAYDGAVRAAGRDPFARPERVMTAAQANAVQNFTIPAGTFTTALTDFAGRPGARSAGGSDSKDERPGHGTASALTQADRFRQHEALGLDLSLVLKWRLENAN
jgi:HK97 family phage prohead protease